MVVLEQVFRKRAVPAIKVSLDFMLATYLEKMESYSMLQTSSGLTMQMMPTRYLPLALKFHAQVCTPTALVAEFN